MPDLHRPAKQKLRASARSFFSIIKLYSPGDLAGTEATGAHINMLRRTVNNRLYTFYIGLPGMVGAAVGVGDLNAEHNALITEFTFSHSLVPPCWLGSRFTSVDKFKASTDIIADISVKSKGYFNKKDVFLAVLPNGGKVGIL